MYTRLLSLMTALIFLVPADIYAQEQGRFETSGVIELGVQQVEKEKANSSKFNEYRDIRDGFYVNTLDFDGLDTLTGKYLELRGKTLQRDDQNIILRTGSYGKWELEAQWDELPHRLSNKAKTPYNYQGSGLYTVPATAGVTSMTTASLAQDALVTDFLATSLHPTDLETQREKGSVMFRHSLMDSLTFNLSYSDDSKEGSKITGSPIGDRPPRTLNAQLAEPVDHQTRDLRFETEYTGKAGLLQFAYLFSQFENENKSLTWQNMFYGATNAADFYNDAIGRAASTHGRIALDPDNSYHNFTLTSGLNLPMKSSLTATASYGLMRQNETLLPYSFSTLTTDWNSTDKLPRTKADAKIEKTMFNLNYKINPLSKLNLGAFYRYDNLDNSTETDEWYYPTQDTANTNGTVDFRNQRKNLAYEYEKQNLGLDAYYTLPWKSTMGLGYEREMIERDYREADTEEDMVKTTLNSRPFNWLSLRTKYIYGNRDGGTYNGEVTDSSYHFSNAAESGLDRPFSAFGNHPDARKFDVSDRERHQFDTSVSLHPIDAANISFAYYYSDDDYDSNVSPTQPLAGVGVADPAAQAGITPGNQLGLLKDKTQRFTVNTNYAPTERISFNTFIALERYNSRQRGMKVNENQRISALFDWNDPNGQWVANIKDRTNTFGLGTGFVIIPKKLNFSTDFTYSAGKVDIDYSGVGSDQPLDTIYYAFVSPEGVSHRQYTFNAALEYQTFKQWVFGLNYLYDKYRIQDWMQEPSGGWAESIGENYIRDSTQDTRWGNRLVSLGSFLAPSYENHAIYVTAKYQW